MTVAAEVRGAPLSSVAVEDPLHCYLEEPDGQADRSSPVLLVSDVDRSVVYYRDRLGFTCEVYGDPPDFIVARRDEAVVLMALCQESERIVPNWRIVPNVWNVFIRVDDVEAIYEEFQRRGAPIDYTLYDAPSGFREFGVQDPDGYDIAIGQPIERDAAERG